MWTNLRIIGLLLTCSWFGIACGGSETQTKVRLTQKERVRVDTLYTREVKVLRPQLDSVCDASFDAMVDRMVDSIIKVRREEEARLRSRAIAN